MSRPGKEVAVFDTSPLVFLDVLGHTSLLAEMHETFIPPAVAEELTALPGEPGSGVPQEAWVEVREPDAEIMRTVEVEMTEGRGEKEAIALALGLGALVIIDDKRARRHARRMGLRLTGTLGVLLRLHRLGLAVRGLEEDLGLLDAAEMRITPALRRRILEAGKGDAP